MDWVSAFAGAGVGIVVGMTGVGGGSLMAPLMILALGVAPVTAVGTDLWFAAITKAVGGVVHHKNGGEKGGPDFQVIRRLCYGSLPAALVTLWFLARTDTAQVKSGMIMSVLGLTLILTAIATLFRNRLHKVAARVRATASEPFLKLQPSMTVVAGAVLGVMVTLTSVGAGALGATMLLALYPRRMNTRRLVATDIIHAVPLTIVAGLGHLWMGNVDVVLLGSLLLGYIPGIIVGSLLASRVSENVLRPALAGVLTFAGVRLVI